MKWPPHPLLRWLYLRWVVGGAITLMFATTVVYVYRSFPQLDGELRAPGLLGPVQIQRDASDVTHIQADSTSDAWFAMGWVHAQERGWQLELNRRIMHGELAEILGKAALPTDKLMRTLGIARAAEAQWARLPTDARDALDAYSQGIAAFYASSRQAWQPEFHLLGTRPGGERGVAWAPADSVGWSLMMALDLGGNWSQEIARFSAAQVLDHKRLWQVLPPYPGEQPVTTIDLPRLYAELGVYLPPAPSTAQASQMLARSEPWLDADAIGNVEGKGSNNWVVSGSRTVSGRPLVANDPHLGLSAPAIWYFARLSAGRGGPNGRPLDVMGATLPGTPFVVLGRTRKAAWGFTNTGPDVQDLYLEQINPAAPAQYRTPQGWADFELREERIKVRLGADVVQPVRSTRHGPVISDVQPRLAKTVNAQRYAVALRWSALDEDNRTTVAAMASNFAQSVPELESAYANHHSPMQNLVTADVDGRILYKAIGRVPTRRADNDIKGMAPSPGWDERYDWADWIPYVGTPRDEGRRGWVSTANQRVVPPGFPYFMGQDWNLPYRFERIEQLLAAKPQHDVESMKAIQNDVQSRAAGKLTAWLKRLDKGVLTAHPRAAEALALLTNFNGAMDAEAAAPLVFSVWTDEVTRAVFSPRLGPELFNALYGKRNFRQPLEEVLLRNDAWWCAPLSCAEQAARALDATMARLSQLYGADPAAWRWGEAHPALSAHRPLDAFPLLNSMFNLRVPGGGDPFTVNVGQYWANEARLPFATRHAASMRAVYDLSGPNQFIYQAGQSGLVFSSRYSDMKDEWAGGRYRALEFDPKQYWHHLTLKP